MTIKKVSGLENNFSILPNDTINAPLSWAAKGLLSYLLSKPDDWNVSVAALVNHSKLSLRPTGRDGTYAIINELLEKGYMQRERTKGGGYSTTDYTVSSTPCKPLPENPDQDNPDPDKPTLQSKESLQRKDLNKLIDQAFETFWSAGMRKVNKKGALAPFKKAFKESEFSDPMLFALHLSGDISKRKASGQFGFDKMHPTTYLNQQRWNDDYETNQPAATQKGDRKLSEVELENQRLLQQYGNPNPRDKRESYGAPYSGMDQHQAQGSFPEQMADDSFTIDLDSGDWSSNG